MKAGIDIWMTAAGITTGTLFRSINKAGRIWGNGFSPKVIWGVVKDKAKACSVPKHIVASLSRAAVCSWAGTTQEAYMFAERYAHFSNVHTIYRDLISGHYQPSVNMNSDPRVPSADFTMQDVHTTMMFVLYAYFFSMVEDDPQGVNGFRVWRAAWPEEENAIAAVEALVTPLVPGLKLFRNRLGFHGSRSRSHEAKAFDLFSQHSGTAV